MGAINISNVGKVYPNGTRALEDVNIEINDGEFVVLVGPSGCGKTTLLRMVAGLEDITEGEISIADNVVNEVAPRPHNSYHFSIEGSYTSQFEQLLRSILDMPLGSTKIIEAAVMVNLVGEKGSNGPVIYKNFDQIIGLEGVNPHIYGKFETRFNRKMGHVTVINENIDKAKKLAKQIKETIIITSEK